MSKQEKLALILLALIAVFATCSVYAKSMQFEKEQERAKEVIQQTINQDKPQVISIDKERTYYNIPLEEQYQDFVFEMCEKYSVPVNIVLGIMWQESKFDFMAVSSDKQCVGIMQVNRINYEELNKQLGVTDLRDPKQNIESGIYIFSKLLHKYGDYHKALVCYNCGEKGAKDKVTSKYSISVINYASSLEVKQCSIVQ